MIQQREPFAEMCIEAFRALVDEFQFEDPEVERIGREVYVRYHKGLRTVSLANEPGSPPIIELFHPPTSAAEKTEFWATRGGVARCRRFPKLRLVPGLAWESPLRDEYLAASARALVDVERAWLAE